MTDLSKKNEHQCCNIMLAEDDEDDILLFKEACDNGRKAIQIRIVNNGLEAIISLGKLAMLDMLFLDINMPLMNGIECLLEVRKSYITLPVIMLTTSADRDLIKQVKALGASGFITKPRTIGKFQATMKEVFSIDWTKHQDSFYLNINQGTILS